MSFPLSTFVPWVASDLQVRGEIFRVKHANLSVPEGAVGFWPGVALGAAVPKARIDEDSDPKLGKSKIWFTRTIEMPSPPGYTSSSHQAQKPELS